MAEDVSHIVSSAEDHMQKAITHLETELIKIRAGKATPQVVDGIVVDYYGSPTPISQVGNISVMDARTLTIQPWEKNMLQPIERAIIAANIGINPQNDGNQIRLFLPPLTEERRKELVRSLSKMAEEARVRVRANRRAALDEAKKLKAAGELTEDGLRDVEDEVQKLTDRFVKSIDDHLKHKEAEIMKV